MVDKDETLFFLRDCIKQWNFEIRKYIHDESVKVWFHTMLNKAKSLLKEHKLLYNYEFTIRTPMGITGGMIKEITKYLDHYLSGYGAEITSREFLIEDERKLPKAPEMCKGCKWLRKEECWYNDEYYGTDFPVDCDGHEKEE